MNEFRAAESSPVGRPADFMRGHQETYQEAYPTELAIRYPYVFEKVTSLWGKPTEARAYFQDLLVTQRETRQGFPMDVYMEIFALSELFNKLNPLPKNADDDFWIWLK